VGKKWLLGAVAERGGNSTIDLRLQRKPFFLYPGGTHPIRPWGDRLDAVYPGGRASITALGRRAGFSFNMEAPLSDTMDSHRLYLWADRAGKGEALAQAIGHEYFENARPLADREMLCACASEVGLDADAAQSYLQSDGGYTEVAASAEANRQMGIHSVPVFIFRSEVDSTEPAVVHGSADVQRFGQVLDAILAAAEAAAESSPAQKDEV